MSSTTAFAKETSSALYAGYASVFWLRYWVVVSHSHDGSYDSITPDQVVETVVAAIAYSTEGRASELHSDHASEHTSPKVGSPTVEVLYGDEQSPLLDGYGSYSTYATPTGW